MNSQSILALEKSASLFDPNLKPLLKRLNGKIKREFSRAESRIISSYKLRGDIIKNHVEKLYVNLYCDNHLQERRLNILSFFHKYYHPLIYHLMELTCCRHENDHLIWRVRM